MTCGATRLRPLLAFVLLLAGCTAAPPPAAPPPPKVAPAQPGPMIPHTPLPEGLSFSVEPPAAAPGSTVTLVLANGTAHQVGYNLCMSGLEHLQSGAWRPIPLYVPSAAQLPVPCPALLMILAPGRQDRYPVRLPTALAPGTYRFTTGVESPLNRGTPGLDQIPSEPFAVRR